MTKAIESVGMFFISLVALRILHINVVDAGIFSSGIGFLLFISASIIEWYGSLKHKLSDIDKSIAELYKFKSDATQITPMLPSISNEEIDGSQKPQSTDTQPQRL